MATLAFFLIVLIAAQGCYGESKFDESEQFVQEYVDALHEVDQIIFLVSENLTSVIRDYEHEFNRIVDSHPTYPIIVNIRKIISELEETESTAENQVCFRDARSATVIITEFVKNGLDACLDDAHLVSDTIERRLKNVEKKATNILDVLMLGLFRCASKEIDVECLRGFFAPIKDELEEVRVEMDTILETIHGQVHDGMINLSVCMQKVQDGAISRGQLAIDNLNDCIKSMTL